MSLVKPIINDIMAFDATQSYTVTFNVSGGDQVTKNQIQVVTNDINESLIYDNTTLQNYGGMCAVRIYGSTCKLIMEDGSLITKNNYESN